MLEDYLPPQKDLQDVTAKKRAIACVWTSQRRSLHAGCTEKIDARAVWGTIIMGLTGLLIWFKVDVTRFFHTRLSVFVVCKPDWL